MHSKAAERFTIGHDPEGRPIKLAVRDMTQGQMADALAWHRVEADRLQSEGTARQMQAAAARAIRLFQAVLAALPPEPLATLH